MKLMLILVIFTGISLATDLEQEPVKRDSKCTKGCATQQVQEVKAVTDTLTKINEDWEQIKEELKKREPK